MQYKEAGKIAETIASEILTEHMDRIHHEIVDKLGREGTPEIEVSHAQVLERFARLIDRLKNHSHPQQFSSRKLQGTIRG